MGDKKNKDKGEKILELNVAGSDLRNVLLKKRYIRIILLIYVMVGLPIAIGLYFLGTPLFDIIFPIIMPLGLGIFFLIVIGLPNQKIEITTNGIAMEWKLIKSFQKWSEFNSYSVDRASNIIYLHKERTFLNRPLVIIAKDNFDDVERVISKYLKPKK